MVQKTEPVNLLVTIDRKYIDPLLVMLTSYKAVHENIDTRLYLAHSSLTKADLERIRTHAADCGVELHDIQIVDRWFRDTPVLERLPEESFYRLMAFCYLPKSVHRCLYLDPDIIIRKSLLQFYITDLEDCYIMASSHMKGIKNKFNLLRLGVFGKGRYVNSGIMLMDLDAIRRDFTVESILKVLEENLQKLWLGDQDLINILFAGRIKLADERIYNLDERALKLHRASFDMKDVQRETAIIHYNGKYKPWLEGYKGSLNCFYPEVEHKGAAPVGKGKERAKAFFRIVRLTKQQRIVVFGVLLMIVASLLCWSLFGRQFVKLVSEPERFRVWLDRYGAFDEVAFVLIRTVQTVFKFVPAEPLEIGAGYVWGAFGGMLWCLVGNLLGTLVILALTKRFGKSFVKCFIPEKFLNRISMLERSNKVYALLFFLYLIPGSPKDGFTYLVGLLPIKTVPFLIITFIARIPSVLSSTLCGSALAEKHYLASALIFFATVVAAAVGGLLYKTYADRKKSRKGKSKRRKKKNSDDER